MNRGALFRAIEHCERQHERALERPAAPPSPRPTPPSSRPTLTATPAALITAANRAKRTQPPTITVAPKQDREGAIRLQAKALKVVVSLDPAQLAQITPPTGAARQAFVIEVDGRRCRVSLNSKGVRKALATIAVSGPGQVSVILQGRLGDDDQIVEAGIIAQPRKPKADETE